MHIAGVVSQSAQSLSKLLVSFATSKSYSQLQLLRLQLLKSQASPLTPHQAQSAEAAAEAVAADWACLLWLLQTAPDQIVAGLRAEWQRHQLQEFATWVRPAAELSTTRSKTAAKVCLAASLPLTSCCCNLPLDLPLLQESPQVPVAASLSIISCCCKPLLHCPLLHASPSLPIAASLPFASHCKFTLKYDRGRHQVNSFTV